MKDINLSNAANQKDWLKHIAPKKFENLDTYNLLRTGTFGYINEIFGNVTENLSNMTMTYYNEIFPNKARLPNSIYTYAALAKYTDFFATGAKIYFVIALKKKDMINIYNSERNGDMPKTFKILKDNPIIVDGTTSYLLDYDILINIIYDKVNDKYITKAQYDMSIINTNSNIQNPYIPLLTKYIQGTEFLIFQIIATQLTKTTNKFTVYEDDLIKNINYEIAYENQLAYFNVRYKHNDLQQTKFSNNIPEIILDGYFTDSVTPTSEKFYFYNFRENIIDISFSAYPKYFRPKFNSDIYVNVYTTLGTAGNISYIGDNIEIMFGDTTYDNEMKNIPHLIYTNSDSIGGKDAKTLEEIQQKSCIEFSTRKNYISEQDLNIFFSENFFTNKLNFVKKRDDVLRRINSAFALFYDKDRKSVV